MSRNLKWVLVFAGVLLVCLAVIFFGQFGRGEKSAEIYLDGELIQTVKSLDSKQIRTIDIESDAGYNKICYGGGKLWVQEADCANQTCVKYAKASLVGETIVCAPHKLVIKITGSAGSDADVTT